MPALNLRVDLAALEASNKQRQRRRMVLALVLLLISLVVIIVKSRAVWFRAPSIEASEVPQDSRPPIAKPPQNKTLARNRVKSPERDPRSLPASTSIKDIQSKLHQESDTAKTVRVPYAEVISGLGQHQLIYGYRSAEESPLDRGSKLSNGTEEAHFSSDNIELVSSTNMPQYPLLGTSMKLQGSVVLLARIDPAGNIESLQVLSGPEILTRAAREAVKQWHFKPNYQAGKAVEADTRITVNFAIVTQ